MKGGAAFKKGLSDDDLRNALGMIVTQGGSDSSAVYVSPLRLLGIQEATSLRKEEEYGNLHAVLVTLPETGSGFNIEFIPDIPQNYFKRTMEGYYSLKDRLQREFAGQPLPHMPTLIDKDAVPTRTRSRQIAALESATRPIPEVVQQKIATMSGLTSKESIPLSDAKSELAKVAPEDIKADAIIDAAIAWVKAWNAEHVAPKGKRKEATAVRKAAEKALDGLEEGTTKAFVPLPREEGSSSSSSSSAAPEGPGAAGAPQGGRRKRTKRVVKKRRITRRR